MILHTKYQDSGSCGLRQKDCFTFSLYYYNAYVEHVTLWAGHLLPQGHNLNKLGIAVSDKNIFHVFPILYIVNYFMPVAVGDAVLLKNREIHLIYSNLDSKYSCVLTKTRGTGGPKSLT